MRWAVESTTLPPACLWPHHSPRLTQPPQAHTTDSDEEECDATLSPSGASVCLPFQPYVPEEFANFEVYNASLDAGVCVDNTSLNVGVCVDNASIDAGVCVDSVSLDAEVCVRAERGRGGMASVCERECVSRSPTASSCTSGYFSHSASCATLSDAAQSDTTPGESGQSDAISVLGETSQSDATVLGETSQSNAMLNETRGLDTTGKSSQSEAGLGKTSQSDAMLGGVALPSSSSSSELPGQGPAHTTESPPTQTHSPSSSSPPLSVHCRGEASRGVVSGGVACTLSPPPDPALCTLSTSPEFSDFQRADEGLGGGGRWPPLSELTTPTRIHTPLPKNNPTALSPTPKLPPLPPPGAGVRARLPPLHNGHSSSPPQQEEFGRVGEQGGGPVEQLPDWMAPGELVWVGGHCGTVHYVGGVEFAAGIWVGVELELAVGKHNGTVQGRVYFRCEAGHGVFVQPAHLSRDPPTTKPRPQPLLL